MQLPTTNENTLTSPALTKKPRTVKALARFTEWIDALKHVLPIYIGTHIAFLILTYTATLFLLHHSLNYSMGQTLHTLLSYWNQWDTGHYIRIAASGYSAASETAFFPLYPLLTHIVLLATGNALFAALVVSNIAGLGMLLVCYRLIEMDFGTELAGRTVLYLAVFPTAFFFAAAYTESLFLLLVLLTFYFMRRGHWWLAGLASLFAGLTRATAVALFIPLCYEYLKQHDFQWRRIRLDILSCVGFAAGTALFALYCYLSFHDALAFSHGEQKIWNRSLLFPGQSFLYSLKGILHLPILTFYSMHNVINLTSGLVILALLILSFVGPWKFARKDWAYPLYGVTVYLFAICLAIPSSAAPLDSLDRYVLAIFPAFITLAAIGKREDFNISYLLISLPAMAFFALLFLTSNWMV